ncbi:hypothetical protein JXJ21_03940 [candidate division KSB1 bacterium]|nr:hypothetical protein [candidate division KSB1 bacterium]
MSKASRVLIVLLAVVIFVAGLYITGCSKKPSKEQLDALAERKKAALAAEDLRDKKQREKADLEKELARKKAELRDAKNEKEEVKKRLESMEGN